MGVNRYQTLARSRVIRFLVSPGFATLERRLAALRRRLSGGARAVHYFHQADDPYSHLVVQKLDALRAGYAIPFVIHLVPSPAADFQGSTEHFGAWAIRDAQTVADGYGVDLAVEGPPRASAVAEANDRLAAVLGDANFAKAAFEVGRALWLGETLQPSGGAGGGAEALRDGERLRSRLGHYLSATFYFEGEWFWGIDRIRMLERRLHAEGLGNGDVLVPEPTPADTTGLAADQVVLEYFPSLRSPYTAVGHTRVMDLIERSGVSLKLRPVMPMMMRGVPAPPAKQRYIVTDAAREARARDIPFGNIVDPFGEPVKRAFALFPAAEALGRGSEFITEYLSAAWVDGVDITQEAGLREVVARAGLEWDELAAQRNDAEAGAVLEENLQAMLGAGLWGVPSFRVSGGTRDDAFSCWGQDRIWRVEDEIAARAR